MLDEPLLDERTYAMDLVVDTLERSPPDALAVEIVERKGLGHPDTICNALAERLSIRLSRHYLERFGGIRHHNVDKALLWGGRAHPRFGGGEVEAPMEIYLAGRATSDVDGVEDDRAVHWILSG